MRRGIVIVVLFMSGCASSQNWYERAGDAPTPAPWAELGTVTFVVLDELHEPLGTFRLQLTGETAEDCASPAGRVARYLGSEVSSAVPDDWIDSMVGSPAYRINGGLITVTLNSNICDDNHFVRAKLVSNGAAGLLYWSSPWDSKIIGNLVAVIHHDNDT